MKKLLAILLLTCGFAHADTTTTRVGLTVPTIGSTGWGTKTNSNWDIVDSSMCILTGTNNFSGTLNFTGAGGPIFQNSNSNGTSQIYNNGQNGKSELNLYGVDGVGVNTTNQMSSLRGLVDLAVKEGTTLDGTTNSGRFAVIGSSADGSVAYSGFRATSSITSSTIWALPKTDGPQGGVMTTDGSGNLNLSKVITVAGSVGVPGSISSITISAASFPGGGIYIQPAFSSFAASVITSSSGIVFGYPGVAFSHTPSLLYGESVLSSSTFTCPDSASNTSCLVITSTGTGSALKVNVQGIASGGYQNEAGAVQIEKLSGAPAPFLVIRDSTTDSQSGTGLFEIWSDRVDHNDPKLWFHIAGHDSSPEIRDDAQAPNWEMINTSTDNAHGYGKWEPAAIAFQGTTLQVNSRSYDNSTFETLAFWNKLSAASNDANGAPGLYFQVQSLTNDSGVLTSSDTAQVRFTGQNGSSVGLTGPLNPVGGSYAFGLPIIPKSAGQLLYFQANRGNNFSVRQTTWTDTDFTYSPTTGVTVSSVTASGVLGVPKMTKAVIGARSPGAVAELVYCTDCTLTFTCVSTGTAAGQYAAQQASGKTTACN